MTTEALIFGTLVAAVMAAVLFGANGYEDWRCSNYSELSGKPVQYVDWDTCYVNHNGRMHRWDEYTAVQREVRIEDD